ncbi:DUF4214 domain-containing protein [Sulfitobacter sp. S190]|uniref:DUF4214 domain-containing protein n=1 Tax=Sulfitobacter sp. S190 TaxID=2867022 RepID=UPI0021A72381|nr:DUF4214 domain-containing protein [Sulfitobacter sp. S190]UWR21260.1 DUF4214 domain-containing protein [Sulfitobacter sp. S190]
MFSFVWTQEGRAVTGTLVSDIAQTSPGGYVSLIFGFQHPGAQFVAAEAPGLGGPNTRASGAEIETTVRVDGYTSGTGATFDGTIDAGEPILTVSFLLTGQSTISVIEEQIRGLPGGVVLAAGVGVAAGGRTYFSAPLDDVPPEGQVRITTGEGGDDYSGFVDVPLTAQTDRITDADGIASDFTFQWYTLANRTGGYPSTDSPIADATAASYTPTRADLGTRLAVEVSYVDGTGRTETVSYEQPGWSISYLGRTEQGDDADNILRGTPGLDTLIGAKGGDVLIGVRGNDRLFGDEADTTGQDGADSIYRLYLATLGREPDAQGFGEWVARNQGEVGFIIDAYTVGEIVPGFIEAPEFRALYGDTDDTEFVTLLYRNVLDRAPDPEGLDGWLMRMNDFGLSRAEVVYLFAESDEVIDATQADATAYLAQSRQTYWSDDVFRLYQATLDRTPDLDGFYDWTARLAGDAELAQVAAGFVASDEFQATYGALDDAAFVDQLYLNALDRASDAAGAAGWVARLADGQSRAEIVIGFSQSAEFTTATDQAHADWIAAQGTDDELYGGAIMVGGILSDTFALRLTDAEQKIYDLEPWDRIDLGVLMYETPQEALADFVEKDGGLYLRRLGGDGPVVDFSLSPLWIADRTFEDLSADMILV